MKEDKYLYMWLNKNVSFFIFSAFSTIKKCISIQENFKLIAEILTRTGSETFKTKLCWEKDKTMSVKKHRFVSNSLHNNCSNLFSSYPSRWNGKRSETNFVIDHYALQRSHLADLLDLRAGKQEDAINRPAVASYFIGLHWKDTAGSLNRSLLFHHWHLARSRLLV